MGNIPGGVFGDLAGRAPVLVDGGLTLPESHAILAYLGEKTGRLWPASAAGRAEALRWLFFLSQHIMPPAGDVALRFRAKFFGRPVDEATVQRGEQALPPALAVVEDHLARNKWMMGDEFGLSIVLTARCSTSSRSPASGLLNSSGSGRISRRAARAQPGRTHPGSPGFNRGSRRRPRA